MNPFGLRLVTEKPHWQQLNVIYHQLSVVPLISGGVHKSFNVSAGKASRITVSLKWWCHWGWRSGVERRVTDMSFTHQTGFLLPFETEHHRSLPNLLTKPPWSTRKPNHNIFVPKLDHSKVNSVHHECTATWDDKVLQWITCLWCSCDALVCSWPNLACYLQWGDPWPQYIGLPDWNNQLPLQPI